jgi:hypothetical protein
LGTRKAGTENWGKVVRCTRDAYLEVYRLVSVVTKLHVQYNARLLPVSQNICVMISSAYALHMSMNTQARACKGCEIIHRSQVQGVFGLE